MNYKIKFCYFIVFILSNSFSFAQDNASLILTDSTKKSKLPIVGLGLGASSYFGNVGYSDFSDPLRSKAGIGLSVEEKLTHHFSLSYELIVGKLYGNDRSLYVHNNFQANIVSNALVCNYYPLKESNRILNPYFQLGIGALYYKTYVDRLDAKGLAYNYWSDNTIRSQPEGSSDAKSSVVIGRDYTYETKVNNGAFAISIPFGFGVNFRISNKVSINLGPTLYYTFTKNIDNVPSVKKGLGFNDRFVYASFSLRYDFGASENRNAEDAKYNQVNFLALENADTDGDGITDRKDKCPGTPVGVKIDGTGCPLDSDKDGIPDYKDKQPDTKSGVAVDEEGIELTDEYIAKKEAARNLQDSLDALKPRAEYIIPEPGLPELFFIQLGSYKNGIPSELVDKYLAIPDVKTKMNEDSLVVYTTGPFTDLSVAENKKDGFVQSGIKEAFVIGYDKDGKEVDLEKYIAQSKGFDISSSATSDTSNQIATPLVNAENKVDSIKIKNLEGVNPEKKQVTRSTAKSITGKEKTIYKVQLGAFSKSTNQSVFKGIKDLSNETQSNGTTRYFAGAFVSKDEANKYRDKLRKSGFETAFTVAFKDEAPVENPLVKDEEGADAKNNDNVVYKIQLGAFKDSVPLDKIKEIGEISKERIDGSLTRYMTGSYRSFEQAFAEKEKIKQNIEFKGAYVVAYKGKKRVKLSQVIPARVQEEAAKSNIKKSSVSKKNIVFKVQLGIFRDEVPADILAVYLTLKDVVKDTTASGLTRYISGSFTDINSANAYKDEVIAKGVKGAFVIAFNDGKFMPLQEAIDATK